MGFRHRKRSDKANQSGSRIGACSAKWPISLFLLRSLLWDLASPHPPRLEALYSSRTGAQAIIKRSSSAIAVTADGAFCLAVNPDSNSLSVIDTSAQVYLT